MASRSKLGFLALTLLASAVASAACDAGDKDSTDGELPTSPTSDGGSTSADPNDSGIRIEIDAAIDTDGGVSHSHPGPDGGGSSADNLALEKYRNTDPSYNQYEKIPSTALPLDVLLETGSPDSNYKNNGFNPAAGPAEAAAAAARLAGQFRTRCEFSHLSYNDPIIKPGLAAAAHLHMFFGNTATDENSTPDSITNSGGSTCDGHEANRTSYWFPAMMDTQGNARIPNQMMLYYKGEGMSQPATGFVDIPEGLRMIAGNAAAVTAQNAHEGHGFTCGTLFTNPNSVQSLALIPECNTGHLSMKVMFPRCWDGSMDFDPADPWKHVRYAGEDHGSNGGTCPSTHPKVFVGLSALFEWDLAAGESTKGWTLSSDPAGKPGGLTIHGDWFGGWHKDVMKAWNKDCVNAEWNCQTSLLGNDKNYSESLKPWGTRVNTFPVKALKSTTSKFYAAPGPIKYAIPPRI